MSDTEATIPVIFYKAFLLDYKIEVSAGEPVKSVTIPSPDKVVRVGFDTSEDITDYILFAKPQFWPFWPFINFKHFGRHDDK